jgi:LysM repeat protein
MNNNLGIIVWGIRNGFKNNWLSYNVSPQVQQNFTDDMRQICNGTVDKFFSIERLASHSVLSIFNPNMKDHVGRRAYIAISIVVPNGFSFRGNPIAALQNMMKDYESKQANAMVNIIEVEELVKQLETLSPFQKNAGSTIPSKIGFFTCTDFEQDALIHFQETSIYGFRKVFFLKGENLALNQVAGIVPAYSFERPLQLTLDGFDPNRYTVRINSTQTLAAKNTVKKGDVIHITDKKKNQTKQRLVSNDDVYILIPSLFPNDKQPVGGTSRPTKFPIVPVFISVMVVCVGLAAYWFWPGADTTEIPEVGKTTTLQDKSDTLQRKAVYDFQKLKITKLPEEYNDKMIRIKNNNELIDAVIAKGKVLQTEKLEHHHKLVLECTSCEQKTIKLKTDFQIPDFHEVKRGQVLSDIKQIFGIKVDDIMRWNNLKPDDIIKPGQKLELKAPQGGVNSTSETSTENSSTVNKTSNNSTKADATTYKEIETLIDNLPDETPSEKSKKSSLRSKSIKYKEKNDLKALKELKKEIEEL